MSSSFVSRGATGLSMPSVVAVVFVVGKLLNHVVVQRTGHLVHQTYLRFVKCANDVSSYRKVQIGIAPCRAHGVSDLRTMLAARQVQQAKVDLRPRRDVQHRMNSQRSGMTQMTKEGLR
jgi:hypothetical protein